MADFFIGQEFRGAYPPEAAAWCGENGAHIETWDGVTYFIAQNPEPTFEELKKVYEDAVQEHLDATARSKGYDSTYTCLSYLQSTDDTWRGEAHTFNSWRDSVWRKCHEILNEVESGEMERPSVEELIARLPKIDW